MDKKKGLRSRLAQYGDEEFALFLRRGFLKGAGFTDEALDKPIVGILSTASDFNPCHKTAPQVAEALEKTTVNGKTPIVDVEDGIEVTYKIVGMDEADISKNKISIASPIARALIGKKRGDEVKVSTPKGSTTYEICAIEYI